MSSQRSQALRVEKLAIEFHIILEPDIPTLRCPAYPNRQLGAILCKRAGQWVPSSKHIDSLEQEP